MTEDRREGDRDELIARDEVGVAKANPQNPHEHFVVARVLDGGRFKREISSGRASDGSEDVHGQSFHGLAADQDKSITTVLCSR